MNLPLLFYSSTTFCEDFGDTPLMYCPVLILVDTFKGFHSAMLTSFFGYKILLSHFCRAVISGGWLCWGASHVETLYIIWAMILG